MPNSYPEIYVQFLSTVVITLVLVVTVVIILLSYQKRRILQQKRVAAMKAGFEKDLMQVQLEIHEEAMKKIAMEIHDNIGQVLMTVNVNQTVLKSMPLPERAQEIVAESRQYLSQALEDLTNLSRSLHPDRILHLGVFNVMRDHLQQLERKGLFKVSIHEELSDEDKKRLPGPAALVLYRMFQELIKNVVVHAQATEVYLEATGNAGGMTLVLRDNGVGFDIPGDDNAMQGIGLRNLNERIQMVKGTFAMQSAPGQGTSSTIFVPYHG